MALVGAIAGLSLILGVCNLVIGLYTLVRVLTPKAAQMPQFEPVLPRSGSRQAAAQDAPERFADIVDDDDDDLDLGAYSSGVGF